MSTPQNDPERRDSAKVVPGTMFDEVVTICGDPAEKAAQLIAYDLEPHTEAEDRQVAEQMDGLTLDEHLAITHAIVQQSKAEHHPVATLGCYSGGTDSTTFMHVLLGQMDHAVHVNTGIGISETRVFVRSTTERWKVPLIEGHPPAGSTYRELVLAHGFPGPAQHPLMYSRLKERALRLVRKGFIGSEGRRKRVLFLSGMRRFESERRFENTQVLHRDGAAVWCSPIAWWPTRHLIEYRNLADVPTSEVSANLHMSGECLCGAYAKPDELEMIRFFYPDTAAEIDALELEVAGAGRRACVWGRRPPPKGWTPDEHKASDPLCRRCVTLFDHLEAESA